LRKKFKIEEALFAEMFQNFIANKNVCIFMILVYYAYQKIFVTSKIYYKVNHGNKSMLLGHEYILWDLTQAGFLPFHEQDNFLINLRNRHLKTSISVSFVEELKR